MSNDELKIQISELQDALQQALEAGLVYKANAEEGAARVEAADRRIYELERNRELFQKQRDEAIRERDRAQDLRERVMKTQPCTIEVEKVRLQPGEVVIITIKEDLGPEVMETWLKSMEWLRRRHPENTFIVVAHGAELDLRTMAETELRRHGLISVKRVDAGVAQLEAAFGAQQAALKRCRAFIDEMIANKDIDVAWSAEAPKLIEALDAILKAELVPDKRPDLRPLLERARACLGQCFEGDGGPSSAELELASEIDAALGEGT